MCEAKKYTEQLLEIYNNINSDFKRYSKELSQLDLYEQDILHIIESGNFNACEGYKLAKMICDNRQRRRQIKNELKPLGELKNNFIDTNMGKLDNTYKKITRENDILIKLTQDKIYKPKVLKTTNIKNILNQELVNKKAIYIKTGEEVTIIRPDSDGLFFVKRKTGVKNYIRKTDLQIA